MTLSQVSISISTYLFYPDQRINSVSVSTFVNWSTFLRRLSYIRTFRYVGKYEWRKTSLPAQNMSTTQVLFTDYLLWRVKLKLLPAPSLSKLSFRSTFEFFSDIKRIQYQTGVCVVGGVAFFTFFLCYFIPAVYYSMYIYTVTL